MSLESLFVEQPPLFPILEERKRTITPEEIKERIAISTAKREATRIAKTPIPLGMQFAYYRHIAAYKTNQSTWKSTGVGTIGYKWLTKTEIVFAYSFCSPKDIYSKVKGRNTVIERLEKHYVGRINLPKNYELFPSDIRTLIRSEIYLSGQTPLWLHAGKWLNYSDLFNN